jgi:hypothetical protein
LKIKIEVFKSIPVLAKMFETYLKACATLVPVTATLAEACKLKAGFHEILL